MKSKDTKITVLGDGGWGTALSLVLADNRHDVLLWGFDAAYAEEIARTRENRKFLPGFHIPEHVTPVSSLARAVNESDILVLASPSQYLRGVIKKLKPFDLRGKAFVIVAKGIETGTLQVMSEVLKNELGRVRFCVLSGPSIAREVALKAPAAVSLASSDKKLLKTVREFFTTPSFSLYETSDVIGVEIGGSLKNVIAISAGIVQGLGYGANTRAALFSRGLAEMSRLGRAMGGKRETFSGLSGLGDLATTCLSEHSRNRTLGEAIGKGKTLKKILSETEMVVEGVDTCRSAYKLAKKHGVSMPIVEAVHGILFGGKDPKSAVDALMKQKSFRETD